MTLSTLTTTPLLTVGTYVARASPPTLGHSIVFDQNGGGMIFPTSGVISNAAAEVLRMDAPLPVEMTGIKLSPKAFAINLADTAYVFDQEVSPSYVLLFSLFFCIVLIGH